MRPNSKGKDCQYNRCVSNRWNKIRTGMVEWTMEQTMEFCVQQTAPFHTVKVSLELIKTNMHVTFDPYNFEEDT